MEIAKYHLGTVIAVVIIVMSLSAFSSNPSIKGTPVFIGAIFLLILATRLLWQANRLIFHASPFDVGSSPLHRRASLAAILGVGLWVGWRWRSETPADAGDRLVGRRLIAQESRQRGPALGGGVGPCYPVRDAALALPSNAVER